MKDLRPKLLLQAIVDTICEAGTVLFIVLGVAIMMAISVFIVVGIFQIEDPLIALASSLGVLTALIVAVIRTQHHYRIAKLREDTNGRCG